MAYSPAESMLIPGFMEPEELLWLHDEAFKRQSVLEVGCWMGRATSALAAGCSGSVFTVDHFQGSPSELETAHAEALTLDVQSEAERYLAAYTHLRVLALPSLTASRLFAPGSLEMVFLDGEHTREAVLVDLLAWRPKASRLLCGHDRDWEGVEGALAVYGLPFEPGPGSIWFTRILNSDG